MMKSLRIALLGYGKMGKMIERIALERGHSIVLRIGEDNLFDATTDALREADVAIEFSHASVCEDLCQRALAVGLPTISGTTGWLDGVARLQSSVREHGGTFLWTSNFSLGVNLFFLLNRQLASLMALYPAYRVSMSEVHHVHKLDAPSGTAITLAEDILSERSDLQGWLLTGEEQVSSVGKLPITSYREGEVPGIHQIDYTSGIDKITIRHEAFSREGFALGAVLAAEYSIGRQGVLSMTDMLTSHTH